MSIGRICCREVFTATIAERALVAARRMAAEGVGTLVIVDASRTPVGVLTDRDLVVRVLAAGKAPDAVSLADVMTPAPKVAMEDGPIEAALRLMRAGGFRRVPVVDRNGALVGILSLDDVLALLAEELTQVGGIVGRQTGVRPA